VLLLLPLVCMTVLVLLVILGGLAVWLPVGVCCAAVGTSASLTGVNCTALAVQLDVPLAATCVDHLGA
jgi:hypothetical protein